MNHTHQFWRRGAAVCVLWAACGSVPSTWGEPVKVRMPEASARGFLVLRSKEGVTLAHGELLQVPNGNEVTTRLTFKFKDGSLYDELATFSQATVFRLESYRIVQKGPAFATALDAAFDRQGHEYQVRQGGEHSPEQRFDGTLSEMPDDLYNGILLTILKNLMPGETATVQMLVFLPKPRLIRLRLAPEGENTIFVGVAPLKIVRYLATFELRGIMGAAAVLFGKSPPDLRYWFAGGLVPAFVQFEGPIAWPGPSWRVEMMALPLAH